MTLSACRPDSARNGRRKDSSASCVHFSTREARSVAASLWSVADESTATLMTKFYTALKAGKSKDEALRSASLPCFATNVPPVHSTGPLPALRRLA